MRTKISIIRSATHKFAVLGDAVLLTSWIPTHFRCRRRCVVLQSLWYRRPIVDVSWSLLVQLVAYLEVACEKDSDSKVLGFVFAVSSWLDLLPQFEEVTSATA